VTEMRRWVMRFPSRVAGAAAWGVVLALALATAPAIEAGPRSHAGLSHERIGDGGAAEDFSWSWKIPAGKTIEIKGVNGAIHAIRTEGDEVRVRATKHARRSDPASVTIEPFEHDGGVTVCAVYPSSGRTPNTCEPGDNGHMHTGHNDVVVDFEVEVPAGVRLVARTVNGSIVADDLSSPVRARTVNGSVTVTTEDIAEATTVNGSIHATIGRTTWDEKLEFATVNGRIALVVPPALDARLEASTVNGDISTDFPVTVSGSFSHRKISGTLGKGGPGELDISTVNGSIRFESAQ
jgi:putative adhesin